VSLAYTQRLTEAGLLASTGSTGDSYDNAMAESKQNRYITLPSGIRIWQPEFADKTLSRKTGAVQGVDLILSVKPHRTNMAANCKLKATKGKRE